MAFADKALTRNQRAPPAASTRSALPAPFYGAILTLANDDPTIRDALDQLSGEVHASANGVLIDDSHFVRDAATARIRSAFGTVGAEGVPVFAYGADGKHAALAPADTRRIAAWAMGFGAWGNRDGDGNAAAISSSTGGFLSGVDAALTDNIRLGLLTGYSYTRFDARGRASSGNSQNWHFGLYGGGQWGAFGLRAGAAYTRHDLSTARSVAFHGFADRLSTDYDAGTVQAFGELGYGIKLGGIGLEPFANLAYVNLHTDGFSEHGGTAAVTAPDMDTGVSFTTVGLHGSTDFLLAGITATARSTVGWRHAFGDTAPLATFAFAGSDPFTVAGTPIAKDAAIVEGGVDFAIASNASLGIAYEAQLAADAQQQSLKGTLNVRF
ncbi:autotransporter domain-containing protein [Mesorhizobium sp. BR1-1-13]|nr:autotransporter domain-containing protein [Mesorhizobium sp. BR1-1-13]